MRDHARLRRPLRARKRSHGLMVPQSASNDMRRPIPLNRIPSVGSVEMVGVATESPEPVPAVGSTLTALVMAATIAF